MIYYIENLRRLLPMLLFLSGAFHMLSFAQSGNLQVTVQNQDGVARSNATVIRYDANYTLIDKKVTDANGQVLWSNIPAANYNLEAYYEGPTPFPGGEFWKSSSVTVSTGSTTSTTLRRDRPYGSNVVLKNNGTGGVLDPNVPIAPGTTVRAEVTVVNKYSQSQSVLVRLLLDRDKTTPFDFDQTSPSQTIAGNSSTGVFIFTYTPSGVGTYYSAIEVETYVNNGWTKTDGWNWGPPNGGFTVTTLQIQNEFFDDFSYADRNDPLLQTFGWRIVDGTSSPPSVNGVGALYSSNNISFENQSGDTSNKLIVLKAATGPTFESMVLSRIGTTEAMFREGTYAAYVCFDDASRTWSDGNVQTLYSINDFCGDQLYSECDFEYLPWDVWSAQNDNSNKLWCTSWAYSSCSGDVGNRDTTKIQSSFSGWHTLLFEATDGHNVRYFVDGNLVATHTLSNIGEIGQSVYPDTTMYLELSNWITNNRGPSTEQRTYTLKCDWIYHAKNVALTSSQVDAIVQNFRSTGMRRKNTMGYPDDVRFSTSEIPKNYNLVQNYPNPFNPSTILRYDLPHQSSVTLKVYNVLGQVVATLVNGVVSAGYQSTQWNAGGFASGVYFYSMKATATGDPTKVFTQVKKMVVVK